MAAIAAIAFLAVYFDVAAIVFLAAYFDMAAIVFWTLASARWPLLSGRTFFAIDAASGMARTQLPCHMPGLFPPAM